MNEHIEYFKRFSNCYLMWSHSNFDRIAMETSKRHLAAHIEERRQRKLNTEPYPTMRNMFRNINEYFKNYVEKDLIADNVFIRGAQWGGDLKIGSTLKIKLPEEIKADIQKTNIVLVWLKKLLT